MNRPNPYPASRMTPAERRAELCRLLALGLIRLHMRDSPQVFETDGESSLHFPPDQSGHATSIHRRTA